MMRIPTLTLMLALGACASSPAAVQPTQVPYSPPPQRAVTKPGCPQYGPLREAIADARGKVGEADQAQLNSAARVTADACNPRNKNARRKADKAMRSVREIREPEVP